MESLDETSVQRKQAHNNNNTVKIHPRSPYLSEVSDDPWINAKVKMNE